MDFEALMKGPNICVMVEIYSSLFKSSLKTHLFKVAFDD